MNYIDIGNNVRNKRTEFGWSEWDLAIKTGLITRIIKNIENGKRCSKATLHSISDALGCNLEELIGDNG